MLVGPGLNKTKRCFALVTIQRGNVTAGHRRRADDQFGKVARQTIETIRAGADVRGISVIEGVRLLEPARRIELGVGPGTAPAIAPYTRGLVYLSKKDGANAAVEFRKIVDRRHLFGSGPAYSLAQLGLARAYALQGDSPKARTAYQDFLAMWKDADSDLLPLKEAQSEYAKLQ